MNDTIQQATADFVARIAICLKQPEAPELGLQELQERLEQLRPSLGTRVVSEASRALLGSAKTIREARLLEAGRVISVGLRELGIRLDPGVPFRRQPRKRSVKPAALQVAEQASAEGEIR